MFTLDFEASCLPAHGRSFPIELGIADSQGAVRAWLIRPQPHWRDWTWTAEAEHLHGLTFDQLMAEGRPAAEVVEDMRQMLAGQPAYADSYLDAGWMRTLEGAASAPPLVAVRHVDALIDRLRLSDAAVARALAAHGDLALRRHRAGDDALWLQGLVAKLIDQAAVSPSEALALAA